MAQGQLGLDFRNYRINGYNVKIGATGKLQVWSGARVTVAPSCATSAASIVSAGGTKLGEVALNNPFAPDTTSGVLQPTLTGLTSNALAAGTAGFYRLIASDGTTCIFQNDVVAVGFGLTLNPANGVLSQGQQWAVFSWQITEPGL